MVVGWLIDWVYLKYHGTDKLIGWFDNLKLSVWSIDWLIDWSMYGTRARGDRGFALVTLVMHTCLHYLNSVLTNVQLKTVMPRHVLGVPLKDQLRLRRLLQEPVVHILQLDRRGNTGMLNWKPRKSTMKFVRRESKKYFLQKILSYRWRILPWSGSSDRRPHWLQIRAIRPRTSAASDIWPARDWGTCPAFRTGQTCSGSGWWGGSRARWRWPAHRPTCCRHWAPRRLFPLKEFNQKSIQNPSEPIRTPLKPIETHQNPIETPSKPIEPFETHQNPSKPIETHRDPSKHIETHRKPIQTHRTPIKNSSISKEKPEIEK